MNDPLVSIIIPIYNEVQWISRLHQSLINNGYPQSQLELIYIDGGSNDGSVSAIEALLAKKHDLEIKLLFNPDRITSRSLNLGIEQAAGEVILRADAHAWYEQNYIENSVRRLVEQPSLGGVGGQVKAVGLGSFWSSSIALAMNSLSGNGAVAYRVGESARLTDTIWCGCWWRDTIRDVGGFNEDFTTNQDYELNFRLRDSGRPLLFDPSIRANYICRDSLSKLWLQYYSYGVGRAHTLYVHPRSLQYRQVLALVPFFAMSASLLCYFWCLEFSLWLLTTYLLILLVSAVREIFNGESVPTSLAMVPTLFAMHISWGLGFSVSFIRHTFHTVFRRVSREHK